MSIPRKSRIVKAMTKQEKEFFRAAMTLVAEERQNLLRAFLERFATDLAHRLHDETKAIHQMRTYMEKQMVALRHAQELSEGRLEKVEVRLKMKSKTPA